MTALRAQLLDRIARDGPISVADYMADCLLHPDHGYYATRDPFGAGGDFTTAPEISQMFGELIGLCLALTWIAQGRPDPVILAEPGPGRGTLMADMLRATASVPGFHAAARVHLVEASPALREVQRQTLKGRQVAWSDSIDALPNGPLLLVANEFFDALPIRQFIRTGAGWRERLINAGGGKLVFGAGVPMPVAALEGRLADTRDGDLVELRPAATAIMADIADRVRTDGGAAVVVDYGDRRSLGDTLQAVRNHQYEDVLANPGEADLTAHVDFGALVDAAEGVATSGLTAQGVLLERLGITARAQALAKSLGGAALDGHIAAHRRLTHPDEMGTLFKAVAFHPEGCDPPPGFEP